MLKYIFQILFLRSDYKLFRAHLFVLYIKGVLPKGLYKHIIKTSDKKLYWLFKSIRYKNLKRGRSYNERKIKNGPMKPQQFENITVFLCERFHSHIKGGLYYIGPYIHSIFNVPLDGYVFKSEYKEIIYNIHKEFKTYKIFKNV